MGAAESAPFAARWQQYPAIAIDLERDVVRHCLHAATWEAEFGALFDPDGSGLSSSGAEHDQLSAGRSASPISSGRFMPSLNDELSPRALPGGVALEAVLGPHDDELFRLLLKATKGSAFAVLWHHPGLSRPLTPAEICRRAESRRGASNVSNQQITVEPATYVLLYTPSHPSSPGGASARGCCSAPAPHLVFIPLHAAASDEGLTASAGSTNRRLKLPNLKECVWCRSVAAEGHVLSSASEDGSSRSSNGDGPSNSKEPSGRNSDFGDRRILLPLLARRFKARYLHLFCSTVCDRCRPRPSLRLQPSSAVGPLTALLLINDAREATMAKRVLLERGILAAVVRNVTQCAAMAARARPRPALVICSFLCEGGSAVDVMTLMNRFLAASEAAASDASSSSKTRTTDQLSLGSVASGSSGSLRSSRGPPVNLIPPLAARGRPQDSGAAPRSADKYERPKVRLYDDSDDSDVGDEPTMVHPSSAHRRQSDESNPVCALPRPRNDEGGAATGHDTPRGSVAEGKRRAGARQSSAFGAVDVPPVVVVGSAQFSAQAIISGCAGYMEPPLTTEKLRQVLDWIVVA